MVRRDSLVGVSHNTPVLYSEVYDADTASFKLLETESVLAFVDIGPISKGHSLVIPKREYLLWRTHMIPCTARFELESDVSDHAATLSDLPDDQMKDILPALKKIAVASVSLGRNAVTLPYKVRAEIAGR